MTIDKDNEGFFFQSRGLSGLIGLLAFCSIPFIIGFILGVILID